LSYGLPTEGEGAAKARAGQVVRTDVPTCELTVRVGEVRDCARSAGWDTCVVINRARVVLGLVRDEALAAPAETPVEEVMEAGPASVRPDEDLGALVERLQDEEVAAILVTTPDGRLIGMLRRVDAERRLAETNPPGRSA
jgi:Mg/Co/Ni transporter MgtE